MERDDTISRSAAIDVVKRLMGDYELSRTVQTGLQILPPTQPTQCNSSNVLRHPQCANRTKLGNCDPVGGFCTSVPKEICDAQEHDTLNGSDLISRQKAIDAVRELYIQSPKISNDIVYDMAIDQAHDVLVSLPSAQPEPISSTYMKAVWTWLLNYQIKAAELKGRYTPYEVLSWVANDWRKEHEWSD